MTLADYLQGEQAREGVKRPLVLWWLLYALLCAVEFGVGKLKDIAQKRAWPEKPPEKPPA